MFFPHDDQSFSRGLTLEHGGDNVLMTAQFHGFLADEKALNQIGDSKGAGGYTNNLREYNCLSHELDN